MSVGILIIMLFALYRVTAREWHSRLPRSPITNAGGLSDLCGSRFIKELDGPEVTAKYVSRASNDIKLKERYRLSWMSDTSRISRWIIDREARNCSKKVDKQVQCAVEEVI
jgi:hypothetical protein